MSCDIPIREVIPDHTPNDGRVIWNANDQALQAQIRSLARNVCAPPYHARGDGITDDRAAIQSALDDSQADGGGYVYFPPGIYPVSGALLLRNQVNLIGAGMYTTTIRLADGANQPVLTDTSAGIDDAYAIGSVALSHFSIDGNKAGNPNGQEGIFSTAYFSTFENLQIENCRTHGIRLGFSGQANNSSQNRIVGCRVRDCDGTGILLDINAPDQIISQNFIHDCQYGIVINNGGVHVINNVVYNHAIAAIQVKQTVYSAIIANNEFNGNRQHAIHVTRTRVVDGLQWSMILISGNSILGNDLEADNQFDAILVETDVPAGIAKVTISGNKVFARGGPNRFRHGVHFADHVVQSKCVANHITDVASEPYLVSPTCQQIELDSQIGETVAAPQIPESGVPFMNPFYAPVTLYLNGTGISSVAVNGSATGLTSGTFRLLPNQTITLTYDTVPSWTWFVD